MLGVRGSRVRESGTKAVFFESVQWELPFLCVRDFGLRTPDSESPSYE